MLSLYLLGQAAQDARANLLRSALSALSLFVAVLSVTAIYTVSAITRDVQLAQEEQKYGRQVTESVTIPAADVQTYGVRPFLDQAAAVAVRGAGSYAAVADVPSVLRVGDVDSPVSLRLTAGNPAAIRRLPVLSGAWYPPEGSPYQSVVVNQAGARVLGAAARFELLVGSGRGPVPAHVVGVIADGSVSPDYYSPLSSTLAWHPGVLAGVPLTVQLHAAVQEGVLRNALTAAVAASGLDPASVEITRVDTTADLAHSIADARRGFLVVSCAALLVSILGLLNVGLASVRDRRREIAIRRATGASRSRVFALVCLSACLGGAAAAAAALVVGIVGVELVLPHFISRASAIQLPHYPWFAGWLGLLVGLAASLLGAVAPATAAARANLSELLK